MGDFAWFRFRSRFLAPALALLFTAVSGCGGGGSGSGPTTKELFVRRSGNDANGGTSPEDAFRSIARAVRDAVAGQTIIVGPGEYTVPRDLGVDAIEIGDIAGDGPLTILANPDGSLTGDQERPGEVLVDARNGNGFGFRVSRSNNVVIDGFRIERARGASESAGIQVRSSSSNVTIRNCEFTRNRDGIRVEASSNVLIFNNLLFDNNRAVRLRATADARIINNTAVDNGARGISIGGQSTDIVVRNNILQDNSNRNIEIDSDSVATYDGDFNLVFSTRNNTDPEDTVSPSTILGESAVLGNASFVDPSPSREDFRLMADSPAIDSGDGTIDSLLLSALFSRTATGDGELDSPPVDLGYHFP